MLLTFLAMLLAGGFYMYWRGSAEEEESHPLMTHAQISQQWRDLGFYCELDDTNRIWTLTGSRRGLLHFPDLLRGYIANPLNASAGKRERYGPYGSLEVMTWTEAGLDGHTIHGSLPDLDRLANLIETKLAVAEPGSLIRLRTEFAPESRYALVLDIKVDGFDPASADPERLGAATQPEPPGEKAKEP